MTSVALPKAFRPYAAALIRSVTVALKDRTENGSHHYDVAIILIVKL